MSASLKLNVTVVALASFLGCGAGQAAVVTWGSGNTGIDAPEWFDGWLVPLWTEGGQPGLSVSDFGLAATFGTTVSFSQNWTLGSRDDATSWIQGLEEVSHREPVLGSVVVCMSLDGFELSGDLLRRALELAMNGEDRSVWIVEDASGELVLRSAGRDGLLSLALEGEVHAGYESEYSFGVPEPGVMMLAGFGALLFLRRRR
jgi:hypothetical protein